MKKWLAEKDLAKLWSLKGPQGQEEEEEGVEEVSPRCSVAPFLARCTLEGVRLSAFVCSVSFSFSAALCTSLSLLSFESLEEKASRIVRLRGWLSTPRNRFVSANRFYSASLDILVCYRSSVVFSSFIDDALRVTEISATVSR